MNYIYLLRHGESEWNIKKKLQGQQDTLLTSRGIKQAYLAANRLSSEKIDRIYTSDLHRAVTTASIIGKELGIDPVSMEEFREMKFGIWESLVYDSISKGYEDEFVLWRKEPKELKIKGAETLEELQARVMKGIKAIFEKDNRDRILIVSHGITIKVIILNLLGIDLNYIKNLTINNVGLSIVENREHNMILKLFNEQCYLGDI